MFCIEVNVLRGGWKLAVLQLHHGATLHSDVEATVLINYLVTIVEFYLKMITFKMF
jgi:hypothetical protein